MPAGTAEVGGAEADDTYAQFRTHLPLSTLRMWWTIWGAIASVAVAAILLVIYVILSSPTLRRTHFNKLIIALALPDLLFSAACFSTCGLHSWNGGWFGGHLQCDIQAVYVVFGAAASVWMNVILASETRRLASCAAKLQAFVPLSNADVVKQVGIAYVIAAVVTAGFTVHLDTTPVYGLACLPLPRDLKSQIMFWTIIVPCLLAVPLARIFYLAWQTYKVFPHGFSAPSNTLEAQQLSEVLRVFYRSLAVLLGFWAPSFTFMWVISEPNAAGIGGIASHLQGFVSALLYMQKADIRQELEERFKWLATARNSDGISHSTPEAHLSIAHAASQQVNRGVSVQLVARMQTYLHPDATTADCVNEHIKPITLSSKCCYAVMVLQSGDEYLRRCIGTATAFVSHSWMYRYSTLVDIIAQHAVLISLTPVFYYIDVFAINQHDVNRQGELDALGQTIVDCGTLVLAASPWSSPLPLRRVWCLYELHMATQNHVPIEMFISSSDTQAFFTALDQSSPEVRTVLDNVDVRQACATLPEDRTNIFGEISQGLGFDAFNTNIRTTMRCSFSQLAMRRTLSSLSKKSSKTLLADWPPAVEDLPDLAD
eukprot:TRINITY_DN17787_c0_g2_i1.p1 TRINITY_DN17787_c0_g2~~TRINITY_DN17787_c0_g2_i1.p1  ORF type:complete len:598 (+),score=44.02 TRINITY_DN17787_c0_g2_i1:188-1981(+)